MNRLDVLYLGRKVGVLAEAHGITFEYDRSFLASGHELSPLNLKLGPGLRTRGPAPASRLPGLFEDSLPDAWGRRVMLDWYRRNDVPEREVTPLAMLAYVGSRGMGALTYAPATPREDPDSAAISLAHLHDTASRATGPKPVDLRAFAAVGSSAGGAQPKALVALPRAGGGEPIDGAGEIPPTHEGWLVKFDVSDAGDHGPLEEAYARLARAAGIDFPESRLLETGTGARMRRHFAVKRFDRAGGQRIHHHTLAALCETGGGDLDYQTFLRVTRELTKDEDEVWRAYRRAAFNVLAGNRDDHGKNHGFLYRDGRWTLGPAYDLTFRSAAELPERGMAVLGERRAADVSHLVRLAEKEGLHGATANGVIEAVRAALASWKEFADAAKVPKAASAQVADTFTAVGLKPRHRVGLG